MSSLLLAFSSFAWFDRPWLCCHWAEPNICHLIAHNLTILLPLLPSYSPKLPSYSPKLSSYSPKLPSFSPKLSSYSPKLPSYSPLLSSNSPLSPSDDCPLLLHISWWLPLPLYSTATTNYSLTGYRREWQLQPIETDKAVAKNMDAAVNNFHINYLSQWETMACHFFFSLDHLTANFTSSMGRMNILCKTALNWEPALSADVLGLLHWKSLHASLTLTFGLLH